MRILMGIACGVLAALPSCRGADPRSSSEGAPSSILAPLPSKASSAEMPPRLGARELTWVYPETPMGPMEVVVVIPSRNKDSERSPVLVAMHGMGEALKGPRLGARGWVDDYGLPRALDRLRKPPLTAADFLGMVRPDRLSELNATLEREPYRGLVIVCPYTPGLLAGGFAQSDAWAGFIVDELLPRVRRETPALAEARSTGIDGVSLGGRAALHVGLHRPEAFGVISALQPAFDAVEAPELAALAQHAVERHPSLRFRLVTSSRDHYLASTRALAQRFAKVGVEANLRVIEGNHSYEFNRGPGVFEMLLFHDRALRDLPWH